MCIGILQTIILEWVTMPSYKQSRFLLISVWVFSFQSPDVQESLSCFLYFHQRKLLYVYYAHRTARGSRKFRSFLHHHLEPESRCVLPTFEKPEKKQSRFFKYDMKQVLTRHLLWLPSEKGATKSPSSNSLSLRFNSSTGLQQRKQQFLRNNPRNSLSRNHYSYLPRVYCRKEDKNACFLVFTWKGLDSILYKLLPEYPTSNDHTSRY